MPLWWHRGSSRSSPCTHNLAAMSPAKVLATHATLLTPHPHSHGFPAEKPAQASSGSFAKPWFTTCHLCWGNSAFL